MESLICLDDGLETVNKIDKLSDANPDNAGCDNELNDYNAKLQVTKLRKKYKSFLNSFLFRKLKW